MHIVILSDSLGRPRPDLNEANRTFYPDVYGYKLKENLKEQHDIELIYIESLDVIDAVFWSQRMVAFRQPDLVIYHIGINDCAPRVFKKNSRSILLRPWFRKVTFNVFMKAIKLFRRQITRIRKLTYVTPEKYGKKFKEMMDEVRKYSPNARFIAVSTAMPSAELDKRSYNYAKNATEFNEVLKGIFENYIEVNEFLPNDKLLINDGIHLTKPAHQMLADALTAKIKELE